MSDSFNCRTCRGEGAVAYSQLVGGPVTRTEACGDCGGTGADVAALRAAVGLEYAAREAAEAETLKEVEKNEEWETTVTEIAQALGCEREWSNQHDHRVCSRQNAESLRTELEKAKEELEDKKRELRVVLEDYERDQDDLRVDIVGLSDERDEAIGKRDEVSRRLLEFEVNDASMVERIRRLDDEAGELQELKRYGSDPEPVRKALAFLIGIGERLEAERFEHGKRERAAGAREVAHAGSVLRDVAVVVLREDELVRNGGRKVADLGIEELGVGIVQEVGRLAGQRDHLDDLLAKIEGRGCERTETGGCHPSALCRSCIAKSRPEVAEGEPKSPARLWRHAEWSAETVETLRVLQLEILHCDEQAGEDGLCDCMRAVGVALHAKEASSEEKSDA